MEDYLKKMAEKAGIILNDKMLSQFSVFYEMLIETNQSMNLTAITEKKDVVLKHFIDSLSISRYYDFRGQSVIDVGTGAGFPGIPLAILYPDTKFVLLDSLKKRLLFIDNVLSQCGINHVTLIHGRAEDYGRDEKYREKFDYCVSRAVAPLPVLLELCTPFVRKEGMFISYKGGQISEELAQAERALSELKCCLKETREYSIPETELRRVFAVFEKVGVLGKRYPRQAGKPKKSPL